MYTCVYNIIYFHSAQEIVCTFFHFPLRAFNALLLYGRRVRMAEIEHLTRAYRSFVIRKLLQRSRFRLIIKIIITRTSIHTIINMVARSAYIMRFPLQVSRGTRREETRNKIKNIYTIHARA